MSVVVMESGAFVLMAKYVQQKQEGGVYYFRRRIPDDVQKHYPGNKTGSLYYSLKTKDLKEAGRKAHQEALRQDAMWKAMRNGDVTHGPEVVDAAMEILRSYGLNPGDGRVQGNDQNGLDSFLNELEDQARMEGAPLDSREAEQVSRHWTEFLPPAYKAAGDLLYGSKPPVFLSIALTEFQLQKRETEDTKAGLDRVRVVNEFIAQFGDQPIEQYSRDQANQFVKFLRNKGNKRSTIVRRLNSIRPVFRTAAREHELEDRRIFESLNIPEDATEVAQRVPYSEDEIRLIQEACREKDDDRRWIIALISDTGMRLGEAVGLKTSDVILDASNPHVLIRPNEARSLKTNGSERVVPLVGASLWAAERAFSSAKGDFLFPRYINQSGGKPKANPTSASQTLIKWLRSQPIEDADRKGNHSFRHSVQDRLRANQTPREIRNAICGWKEKGVGEAYGKGYPLDVLASHLNEIVISDKPKNMDSSVPTVCETAEGI